VRFRSYIIDRELQGRLHHSRLIYNNRSLRTGLPPTITMSDWLVAWQSLRFSIPSYIKSCLESSATDGIRTQPNDIIGSPSTVDLNAFKADNCTPWQMSSVDYTHGIQPVFSQTLRYFTDVPCSLVKRTVHVLRT
jgi:hypothetical protein